MDLESMLQDQATKFVDAVMEALRGASLDELLGETPSAKRPRSSMPTVTGLEWAPESKPTKASSGRLARRTPKEIGEVVDRVVALLKKHPDGLRSEQIQKELSLDKREVPRVLKQGIASRALKSKGQKRATTYSVGGGRSATKVKAKRAAAKRSSAKTKKAPKRTAAKKSVRAPKKAKAAPAAAVDAKAA